MSALAVIAGFFIAGLTIAFVFLAGGIFMGGALAIAALWVLSGLGVWFAVRRFWTLTEVFPEQRLLTGILIPLPLLFAGVLIMAAQPLLLQSLDARALAALSAWLFFLAAVGFVSAIRGAGPTGDDGSNRG